MFKKPPALQAGVRYVFFRFEGVMVAANFLDTPESAFIAEFEDRRNHAGKLLIEAEAKKYVIGNDKRTHQEQLVASEELRSIQEEYNDEVRWVQNIEKQDLTQVINKIFGGEERFRALKQMFQSIKDRGGKAYVYTQEVDVDEIMYVLKRANLQDLLEVQPGGHLWTQKGVRQFRVINSMHADYDKKLKENYQAQNVQYLIDEVLTTWTDEKHDGYRSSGFEDVLDIPMENRQKYFDINAAQVLIVDHQPRNLTVHPDASRAQKYHVDTQYASGLTSVEMGMILNQIPLDAAKIPFINDLNSSEAKARLDLFAQIKRENSGWYGPDRLMSVDAIETFNKKNSAFNFLDVRPGVKLVCFEARNVIFDARRFENFMSSKDLRTKRYRNFLDMINVVRAVQEKRIDVNDDADREKLSGFVGENNRRLQLHCMLSGVKANGGQSAIVTTLPREIVVAALEGDGILDCFKDENGVIHVYGALDMAEYYDGQNYNKKIFVKDNLAPMEVFNIKDASEILMVDFDADQMPLPTDVYLQKFDNGFEFSQRIQQLLTMTYEDDSDVGINAGLRLDEMRCIVNTIGNATDEKVKVIDAFREKMAALAAAMAGEGEEREEGKENEEDEEDEDGEEDEEGKEGGEDMQVEESEVDFSSWKIRELKDFLARGGVDTSDMVEKSELVAAARDLEASSR